MGPNKKGDRPTLNKLMRNISTQKRNESDKLELILLEIGVKDFKLPEVSGFTLKWTDILQFLYPKSPKTHIKDCAKFRSFVEPYRDF